MNTLHEIDCMEYMADILDNHYDLAIVDPDFGLDDKLSNGGTWASKYKKGDGILGGKPKPEYYQELFRISKNQIIWGGNYFTDNLYESRGWIIWDKIAHMDTLADCELAWTSFDRNTKIFKHVRNTPEKRIHITQKPILLYKWLLTNYAKPGWLLLDTHSGSGSFRVAAYDLGFDLDSCELDHDYCVDNEVRYREHIKYNEPIGKDELFTKEEIQENIYSQPELK